MSVLCNYICKRNIVNLKNEPIDKGSKHMTAIHSDTISILHGLAWHLIEAADQIKGGVHELQKSFRLNHKSPGSSELDLTA